MSEAKRRDREVTAEWRRHPTGSQASLAQADMLDPAELELRLARHADEREAKRVADKREARQTMVKFAAVAFGLVVALVTTAVSVVGWWTQQVRAGVERETAEKLRQVEQASLDARLGSVEQAVADVERVLVLERVERNHEQAMLRMILEGQGQTPPDRPDEVVKATTEISTILAK